jgi:hypothetical protein
VLLLPTPQSSSGGRSRLLATVSVGAYYAVKHQPSLSCLDWYLIATPGDFLG